MGVCILCVVRIPSKMWKWFTSMSKAGTAAQHVGDVRLRAWLRPRSIRHGETSDRVTDNYRKLRKQVELNALAKYYRHVFKS